MQTGRAKIEKISLKWGDNIPLVAINLSRRLNLQVRTMYSKPIRAEIAKGTGFATA